RFALAGERETMNAPSPDGIASFAAAGIYFGVIRFARRLGDGFPMEPQAVTLPLLPLPSRRAPVRHPRLAVPRLSIVLVNYHSWDDTARLVRRLRAEPALRRGAAEVVVVDN